MIGLPPYVLLVVFGLFLAGFLFFSLANIILLARFGARNAVGLLAVFIFIAVTSGILFLTWQSLEGTDWTANVPLFAIPASVF